MPCKWVNVRILAGTLVTLILLCSFYAAPLALLPSYKHLPKLRPLSMERATANGTLQVRRLTDCTLADIQSRPGVMVLSTTNSAFLDITLNLLASIRRTGVCVNTTLVAADDKAHRYLVRASRAKPGLNVLRMLHGNHSEKLALNSDNYRHLTNQRPGYLLSFLSKGYEVLYTDSDTYWFKDPFPYFRGNFDVAMLNERSLYPDEPPAFCDGFGYFKPTLATKEFLKKWITMMNQHPRYPDQRAMNYVLQKIKQQKRQLTILSLDMSLFPGGKWFYDSSFYEKNRNKTVAMHSSFVINHDAKVAKYKEFNMWHYNATNTIT